jgi:hypothetical protein
MEGVNRFYFSEVSSGKAGRVNMPNDLHIWIKMYTVTLIYT